MQATAFSCLVISLFGWYLSSIEIEICLVVLNSKVGNWLKEILIRAYLSNHMPKGASYSLNWNCQEI